MREMREGQSHQGLIGAHDLPITLGGLMSKACVRSDLDASLLPARQLSRGEGFISLSVCSPAIHILSHVLASTNENGGHGMKDVRGGDTRSRVLVFDA
jgi:hypothetical protein